MPDFRTIYEPISRAAAFSANIDADVFVSLIERESKFDPDARSSDGSVGIAQLQPQFHAVDATDPIESLHYAARLLASYRVLFGGRYDLALAAYNLGSPAVVGRTHVPLNGRTELFVAEILSRSMELRNECRTPELPVVDPPEPSTLDTISLAIGLSIGVLSR